MSRELLEQMGTLIFHGARNAEYWSAWRDFLSQLAVELQQIAETEPIGPPVIPQQSVREPYHDIHLDRLARECSQPQMIAIAVAAAARLGIPPPSRNDKRKKARMIAWFETHAQELEQIVPFMDGSVPDAPISLHDNDEGDL
jgi:hypothetical protein